MLEPELPLLLGVLGLLLGVLVLGEGVLGEVVLGAVVAPPVAPALLPDLKYSSHSERDTWPSLFLSTDENSGAVVAAPLGMPLALPPAEELDGVSDEPLELPVALGELPEAPLDDEPEVCAMETLARAKSAAAVAVPTSFNIG